MAIKTSSGEGEKNWIKSFCIVICSLVLLSLAHACTHTRTHTHTFQDYGNPSVLCFCCSDRFGCGTNLGFALRARWCTSKLWWRGLFHFPFHLAAADATCMFECLLSPWVEIITVDLQWISSLALTVHAHDLFFVLSCSFDRPVRVRVNRITFTIIEQQSHGFVLLHWGTPKVQPGSTAHELFQDNSAKRGWARELILWDDASRCNCNPHWHKLAGLVSRVIGCHLVGLFDLVFPHWGTCWCHIRRQPLNQRLNFLRLKFLILALIH